MEGFLGSKKRKKKRRTAELGAAPARDVAARGAVFDHGVAPVAAAPALLGRQPLDELHVLVLDALHGVRVRRLPAVHAREVARLAPGAAEGRVGPVGGDEQAAVGNGAVVPGVDRRRVLLPLLHVSRRQGPGDVPEARLVVDGVQAALGRPLGFGLERVRDEAPEARLAIVVATQLDQVPGRKVVETGDTLTATRSATTWMELMRVMWEHKPSLLAQVEDSFCLLEFGPQVRMMQIPCGMMAEQAKIWIRVTESSKDGPEKLPFPRIGSRGGTCIDCMGPILARPRVRRCQVHFCRRRRI